MNNEMNNNNVNNQTNPSGINFVQGGMPAGNVPNNNVEPQQPVYTVPVQTPAPTPVTPTPNIVTPQPVVPEPLAQPQTPMNFVSFNPQAPSNPAPSSITPAPTITPAQNINSTIPQPGIVSPSPTPMVPPQSTMGPMPGPMMPGSMPPNQMAGNVNAGTNPEGEKPKLPIVMIIVTILVVGGVATFLILFLTGKISFGGGKSTTPTPVENVQTEVVLADWMNYLLDQNPTEIKINRYVDADNTKSATLDKDQLQKLFEKIKTYSLVKYYSLSQIMSNDDLQVTYSKDGNTYNFILSGENINFGEDEELKAIFANDNITIEDDGQTSRDSEDYNFILKNFDTKIYDEYFKENE